MDTTLNTRPCLLTCRDLRSKLQWKAQGVPEDVVFRYRPATRKNDGHRPETGASDAQLLAFVLFVGEGAHPWVGGLLGFPCLSLGPPAGAPNKDIDVVNRI